MPVVGRKYLFGSNDNKQENSNFGNSLKDVFYKMYGHEITSRWIRASASTYINGGSKGRKKDLSVRKDWAEMMAHSRALSEQYEKLLSDDEEEDEAEVKEQVVKSEGVRTRSRKK